MILDKILASTTKRIENAKKDISLKEIMILCEKRQLPIHNFKKALVCDDVALIAEVKKASPSKGIIDAEFDYATIAKDYEKAGASAVSVLTEPEFFKGSNDILTAIKKEISLPILRKDFTIDPYQIYEAKYIGADAILLIASLLPTKKIIEFLQITKDIGLNAIVEVHDETEMHSALEADADIIGVNNRDLKTFKVDINTCLRLKNILPPEKILVCESGITSRDDINALRTNNINAALIGETFMRAEDKISKIQELFGGKYDKT